MRYYLIPMSNVNGVRTPPARCAHERLIAFRNLARRLPGQEGQRAIELGNRIVRDQRLRLRSQAGVQFITRYGAGVAHSYLTIARLVSYDGGGDGNDHITVTPLVVSGNVATVTANYPASSYPGHVPHRVITERVRNNVVIFVLRGGWDPPSLTYRSATGTILWSTRRG